MSSSLRNSLHRRNHKERSQLGHRARLGILEKHKDYVKRARDYHSKQDRIKKLREKASLRNKDEFYFGMVNSKTKGGVHVKDRGNQALPTDFVKILKTQDENYVRSVRQAGRKKIDKLKAQLTALVDLITPGKIAGEGGEEDGENALDDEDIQVLQDAGVFATGSSKNKGKAHRKSTDSKPKHVIFVSSADEAQSYKYPKDGLAEPTTDTQQNNEDEPLDLGWDWDDNKTSKAHPAQGEEEDDELLDMREVKKDAVSYRKQLLKELAARLKRDLNLRYAIRELEMQRLMMGKGAARKIRGTEKSEKEDEDKDEDALDARKEKRRKVDVGLEEKQYRPRVYKWRAERKK
ncbi:hypothetical protein M422DRAFT_214984 [Sphaerobolus stellatus SS14]|uniref:U3 small nucleolar RNA-associated protein 11 n=1 Tax=Sphaerobolus stellatus (strain SS14) TaxID=990650 RepID=A0A0C9UVY8_SPHS4|nr:hypothetical protein M422DRAFT_214984 [Sphaerobolus stellatus SS14]